MHFGRHAFFRLGERNDGEGKEESIFSLPCPSPLSLGENNMATKILKVKSAHWRLVLAYKVDLFLWGSEIEGAWTGPGGLAWYENEFSPVPRRASPLAGWEVKQFGSISIEMGNFLKQTAFEYFRNKELLLNFQLEYSYWTLLKHGLFLSKSQSFNSWLLIGHILSEVKC